MDNVTIIRIVAGLVFLGVLLPVVILPYWMIFKKAGFSPALSLLMLFPFINIVVLYVVAFSTWKITQPPPPYPAYPPSSNPPYPPYPNYPPQS